LTNEKSAKFSIRFPLNSRLSIYYINIYKKYILFFFAGVNRGEYIWNIGGVVGVHGIHAFHAVLKVPSKMKKEKSLKTA